QRGGLRELQVRAGESRAWLGENLPAQHRAGLRLQRVDRRPGADDVVIVGIALRLHQAHAAAGRAALVIGAPVRLAVIGADEMLARRGHLVDRAVAEVLRGFGIGGPGIVPHVADRVAAVGLQRGVALAQPLARGLDGDVADPPAAAEAEHLAVPARRQAVDHADVRAADGRERGGHFAIAGEPGGFFDPLAARRGGTEHGRGYRLAAVRAGERREAGGTGALLGLRGAPRREGRQRDRCPKPHDRPFRLSHAHRARAIRQPSASLTNSVASTRRSSWRWWPWPWKRTIRSTVVSPANALSRSTRQGHRALAVSPSSASTSSGSCATSSAIVRRPSPRSTASAEATNSPPCAPPLSWRRNWRCSASRLRSSSRRASL